MASNASQFMRVESYSKVPGKLTRRNGHRSAAKIIDELVREPHACPHVDNPMSPVILLGDPLTTLNTAYQMADKAVDAVGRTQRKDAHILAGCICSYLVPVVEVLGNEEEKSRLTVWIDKCAEWAATEFGKPQISSIVLHHDETKPHLHIMLIPPAPGVESSPLRRAGKAAVAAATDKKHARKLERQAYKKEGIRLQDSYHSAVSINFGHMRHGVVKRKRLSPLERKIELAQARSLQEAIERAQALDAKVKLRQQLLESGMVKLAEREKDLELREVGLVMREDSLQKSAKELVDALLTRAMTELHNLLPSETCRAAAAALRRARVVAGLDELARGANPSSADVSDARLVQLAGQLEAAGRHRGVAKPRKKSARDTLSGAERNLELFDQGGEGAEHRALPERLGSLELAPSR